MDEYKYTLKYQCGNDVLEYSFDADITMDGLKDHLRNFLRGCSWTEEQTKFLESEEE